MVLLKKRYKCDLYIYLTYFFLKKLTQYNIKKVDKKKCTEEWCGGSLKEKKKRCWFGETACTMWHDWNHAAQQDCEAVQLLLS